MLLEQPLTRGRLEIRKTLEVAAGGAHQADRQVKQQRPDTATQGKQSRKRQQREQAQQSKTSPRRPVAGREQCRFGVIKDLAVCASGTTACRDGRPRRK